MWHLVLILSKLFDILSVRIETFSFLNKWSRLKFTSSSIYRKPPLTLSASSRAHTRHIWSVCFCYSPAWTVCFLPPVLQELSGKLIIAPAEKNHSGAYVCVARNTVGVRESRAARLSVLGETTSPSPLITALTISGFFFLTLTRKKDPQLQKHSTELLFSLLCFCSQARVGAEARKRVCEDGGVCSVLLPGQRWPPTCCGLEQRAGASAQRQVL